MNHYQKYSIHSTIIGITILTTMTTMANNQKINCKNIITTYCKEVSGFGISKADEENIRKHGGAPTYGEMTFKGTELLINYLKPKKSDVFIDAGSGVGKVSIQFFFSTDISNVIGIELSEERYKKSKSILDSLQKNNEIPKGRALEFYNQDILHADLSGATLFFMCSTCFSDKLMQNITEKLSKLKPGLRVITLKKLPERNDFKLVHQMNVTTTWSNNTIVYVYELLSNACK